MRHRGEAWITSLHVGNNTPISVASALSLLTVVDIAFVSRWVLGNPLGVNAHLTEVLVPMRPEVVADDGHLRSRQVGALAVSMLARRARRGAPA